jgi:hypothetical protein
LYREYLPRETLLVDHRRLRPRILRAAVLLSPLLCSLAWAQAPFDTDDTNVAARGKWHLEINNEYDVLQPSNFPNLRQNTANFKASYGIWNNVEVGFDNQLLAIFNASTSGVQRTAFGYGDIDLSVKWHFYQENGNSWLPSLGASFNLELPTGDERRQLGSGIVDYYLNTMAQKTLTEKTTLRLNGGLYFAGNTETGVVGVRTHSGFVYTGSISVVRDFTKKLDLGVELFGAVSKNFDLGRGQLQTKVGGNYHISDKFSIDFGLITGYYQSSPRVAPVIGFSKDF